LLDPVGPDGFADGRHEHGEQLHTELVHVKCHNAVTEYTVV